MSDLTNPVRSVAILGTGAMGGMYAHLLSASGLRVVCVAGGERGRRLQADGLIVNDTPVKPTVFDPQQAAAPEPVDLVLVCVKHYQLDQALTDVAPLVAAHTLFVSVLNGLDSEAQIQQAFPDNTVMLCIALAMDATREDNRIIYKNPGRLVFGLPEQSQTAADTKPAAAVRRIQVAFDAAGMGWDSPSDMTRQLWFKFMINVGINQASGIIGAPYGVFHVDGPPRRLMDSLIREVIAVSLPAGVGLTEQDLQRWHQVLANLSATGKTSMVQDLEAGRPTEVDIFAGKVVELGRRYGIATPTNAAAQQVLSVMSGQST